MHKSPTQTRAAPVDVSTRKCQAGACAVPCSDGHTKMKAQLLAWLSQDRANWQPLVKCRLSAASCQMQAHMHMQMHMRMRMPAASMHSRLYATQLPVVPAEIERCAGRCRSQTRTQHRLLEQDTKEDAAMLSSCFVYTNRNTCTQCTLPPTQSHTFAAQGGLWVESGPKIATQQPEMACCCTDSNTNNPGTVCQACDAPCTSTKHLWLPHVLLCMRSSAHHTTCCCTQGGGSGADACCGVGGLHVRERVQAQQ